MFIKYNKHAFSVIKHDTKLTEVLFKTMHEKNMNEMHILLFENSQVNDIRKSASVTKSETKKVLTLFTPITRNICGLEVRTCARWGVVWHTINNF